MATIHSLEVFISVYESLNITDTARQMYCSQPAVSRIIQDLQMEFNVVLFDRFHRKIMPTAAADRLYRYAVRVIADYRQMERSVTQQETIRIGSTVTISNVLLPSLIHAFQKENNIRLEVIVYNGSFLQDALMNNKIDIALIEDAIHYHDLQAEQFASDHLVLIVPPSHPLACKVDACLKNLDGLAFLKRDEGSAVREYTDLVFEEHGIQVDTIWQSTSTRAIVNAVKQSIGVTILPYRMCTEEIEKGEVIPVTLQDISFKRHYYVVTHKQKIITDAMRKWMDLLHHEK